MRGQLLRDHGREPRGVEPPRSRPRAVPSTAMSAHCVQNARNPTGKECRWGRDERPFDQSVRSQMLTAVMALQAAVAATMPTTTLPTELAEGSRRASSVPV